MLIGNITLDLEIGVDNDLITALTPDLGDDVHDATYIRVFMMADAKIVKPVYTVVSHASFARASMRHDFS